MVRAAVGIDDAAARRGERPWFKEEVRKSQGGDNIRRMRGTDRSSRQAVIGRVGQVLQSKYHQRTRDGRRRVMSRLMERVQG